MLNHILARYFHEVNIKLYIIVLLAFSLLLFLSGCKMKSVQLQELENLASYIRLTMGREVSRWSHDKEAGLTGPIYARIRIEYEPINNYTKEEVYNEIVDILKKNDWKGQACIGCSTPSFSASLRQDDYPIPINARVRVHSGENLVSISIEHPRP